ncbi:MAG: Sll0314/Alr1548 family TPR repeat-containing protein [Leptolyngbyaceae cyanobacterium]
MSHTATRFIPTLRWFQLGRRLTGLCLGIGLAIAPLAQPGWAGDPFRTTAPRDISDTSETVFYAMFRDGDYVAAREALSNPGADADDDPLFHALGAAFAYLDEDWDTLEAKAALTKETATQLMGSDPLRGNLYEAVGIFLEGAYILQTEGIAQGTPRALGMLQQVFDRMDTAEAIDPQDPELSLLKGYMDLLLSVNLPFANPERAITQLANYGYPPYVSYRGIALGYRDLDRDLEALDAVNVALEEAPENPDLMYLKAQVLRRLDRTAESIEYFDLALEYADQLPASTSRQIAFERCHITGADRTACRQQANEQFGS